MSPATGHEMCPSQACTIVPGNANAASEQAKDFLIGCFRKRAYAGTEKETASVRKEARDDPDAHGNEHQPQMPG